MSGKEPLVIILGAGASCALGIPGSKELTTRIISALYREDALLGFVDEIDAV